MKKKALSFEAYWSRAVWDSSLLNLAPSLFVRVNRQAKKAYNAGRAHQRLLSERQRGMRTCEWLEEDNNEWWTSCHNVHTLIDGSPTDNELVYCGYCSKRIKETPFITAGSMWIEKPR